MTQIQQISPLRSRLRESIRTITSGRMTLKDIAEEWLLTREMWASFVGAKYPEDVSVRNVQWLKQYTASQIHETMDGQITLCNIRIPRGSKTRTVRPSHPADCRRCVERREHFGYRPDPKAV